MNQRPASQQVTGLFGGSFDPVHIGHLNLVRQLRALGHVEQVIFIPAAVPPHKRDRQVTPGPHRLAMLERALEHEPACCVSDYELRSGGISYTIDTVDHLAKDFPQLCLIIGMDSLRDLHTWYRADDLLNRCRFLVYARPGYETPSEDDLCERFGAAHGRKLADSIVAAETCDVSSTEIREAIQGGNAPTQLLPPGVWEYIQAHNLYR